MAVNAAAPFVLCSQLKSLLSWRAADESACAPRVDSLIGSSSKPDDHAACLSAEDRFTHVVNVSALEGKFSVGKKSTAHPHTNMAKAALNMMTLTSSRDFLKSKILVNAVDTGWVTDMAPLGQGAKAKTHATHVGPPLDEEDGAARVLDPIFVYANEGVKHHGTFFKDYRPSPW